MKGLETGNEKVNRICKILKEETLEPAKREANELIENARKQAEVIVSHAREQSERILTQAKAEIEKQKNIFQASLSQACRQTLDSLKEKIERKLVNPELGKLIAQSMQDPKGLAHLITVIVEAVQKEGVDVDLSAYIPSCISVKDMNQLLGKTILQHLREKSVLLSAIGGGVEVKILKNNITIDLSDTALKELVSEYIRKDFRDYIFGA